jgi:predicted nucleic acid-binding protein
MPDFLLDCNHLSAALRKVSPVRERIHQGRRVGHRFISCYPVLCELDVGIQQTSKPDENRRRLAQLQRHIRLWPLDAESTRFYGGVYIELRRLGRALPQVT